MLEQQLGHQAGNHAGPEHLKASKPINQFFIFAKRRRHTVEL